jgi:hypothetical protein
MIKNPGCFTNRAMFLSDAGVLNGHAPTAKFHQASLQFFMGSQESGRFEGS